MSNRPHPSFHTADEIVLVGTMAVYGSQAEASEGIPRQWRSFLIDHPELKGSSELYGASPCTANRKIHYLTGVVAESSARIEGDEHLALAAGEYAVVRVDDAALLRDTWIWLLGTWLASSGRKERNAPEFERYTSISDDGAPVGAVEIWIPIEAAAG